MVDNPTNFSSFGAPGQANPYGAPRVTVASNIPVGPTRTKKTVNWGSVVKGVAIIAAVAVVAVVGYWALVQAGAYLAAQMAAPTPLGMAASALVDAGNAVMGGIKIVSDFVIGAVSTLVSPVAGATANTAAAAVVTNTSAVGTVGAIAGTTLAAPTAITAFKSLAFTNTTPIDPIPPVGAPLGGGNPSIDPTTQSSGILSSIHGSAAGQHAATASMHTLNDLAHHAAEHGNEHSTRWSDRFSSHNANFSSHADAVGGRKVTTSLTPRNDSFTDQLNADRLNLEASLGQKII